MMKFFLKYLDCADDACLLPQVESPSGFGFVEGARRVGLKINTRQINCATFTFAILS